MQDSSPTPHLYNPSTPRSLTRRCPPISIPHQPMNSSPLAESPRSSPITVAQRRRSGYKTPFAPLLSTSAVGSSEDPQKTFLRERFKAKCFERAKRDRNRALKRRRSRGSLSGGSSDADDDADMESEDADMDDNADDEESFLQDEVRYRSPSLEICKLIILPLLSSSSEESCKTSNGKRTTPTVFPTPMK